ADRQSAGAAAPPRSLHRLSGAHSQLALPSFRCSASPGDCLVRATPGPRARLKPPQALRHASGRTMFTQSCSKVKADPVVLAAATLNLRCSEGRAARAWGPRAAQGEGAQGEGAQKAAQGKK